MQQYSIKTKAGEVLFSAVCGSFKQCVDLAVAFKIPLTGADLSGENLGEDYTQSERYFQGDFVQGAQMAGAELEGAQLQGTQLISANLQGAFLAGADFTGANAANINVTGADLSRTSNTRAYGI